MSDRDWHDALAYLTDQPRRELAADAPQEPPVEFADRELRRLVFLRWLYERGQLTEWI